MATDLSQFHRPVSNLVPWPQNPDEWERYRLTEGQIADFDRQGYIAGIKVLDDPQIEVLCSELAGLMRKSHPANSLFYEYHSNESLDPDTALFHALGAWRAEPGFHDILWNPAILMPMAQLLRGPIRLWHDQLFCKPAKHGGVVAWHQDYSFWTGTAPMAHITCWIGLDDSTRENGCLYYVPGSQRWRVLPRAGLTGNMEEIETVLKPEQKEAFRPVPIELRRGECSFHHPLLVHGSYANYSERPRRATLVNAFRDGVRSATDEELLAGVPRIPINAPMSGRFFPILFDPQLAGLELPPSAPLPA
ncbi:MAG: phytanoyl-CoA dioxygenase family protein [Acidobacteriaceae bacterium]